MQITLALRRRLIQPEVIRRNVEFAEASRDLRPVLDRDEPFVIAQVLAQLAGQRMQQVQRFADFIECGIKRLGGNVRVVPEGGEHLTLTLELLQQFGFEVRAGDFEDFEENGQRRVVIMDIRCTEIVRHAGEQILEPQQGTNAFGQRIFEDQHDR